MKIGIDARLFGIKHRGIGRYTQQLIEHLETIDHENQYVIFLQKDCYDDYQPKNDNFSKLLADFKAYSFKEQLLFTTLINSQNIQLMHFTHLNVPIFFRRPFIATIHDLIITHHPDSRATTKNKFLYRLKLLIYKFVVRSAAQRALKIITVSDWSKNDIANTLKINPSKIFVTYEGFDQVKKDDNKRIVEDKYLLAVGAAYPHKNLEKFIAAFSSAKLSDYTLVLVGKKDFFYDNLKKWQKRNYPDIKINYFGQANDLQLANLYSYAELLVMPSLMEGFGLPPLEAQALGIPVASSNKSSLPEILGEGAIYFDPSSAADMALIITKALHDKEMREKAIEKGLSNVKKYSWALCATQTLEIYRGQNQH